MAELAQIMESPAAGHLRAAARFHMLAVERGQALGHIYFIQGNPGGPIKIGWSLEHPDARRLAVLQTGNPEVLRVLAVLPGFPQVERELHEHFQTNHIRGEWFAPSEPLLALIERVGDDLMSWEQLVF